jgi:hypothetical protein
MMQSHDGREQEKYICEYERGRVIKGDKEEEE